MRPIKDAKDVITGDLIYFTSHVGATYFNDGSTLESVLDKYVQLNDSIQFITGEEPGLRFKYGTGAVTYWNCTIINNTMYLGPDNYQMHIDKTGNVYAEAFYQTSDATKKNIIDNVYVSLRDIANAPSVKFTWKNGNSDTQVGTIAQYWKEVLPEVVRGTEGTYSVDYGTLATINSISLAKIIEKQEKRISELEVELENIKTFLQKQDENFER